ncbi:hypothetical protein OEZ85_002278 [Tetradesmus obliquus]|uniref:Uncharacterized protein n=1 Tax=Tetradesmus obliquus TaxID=3088 RepID=A0ABY8U2H3_TETOB|nr:hypothetical protein OEZ85_002278 [Tetradesmus obliquus]
MQRVYLGANPWQLQSGYVNPVNRAAGVASRASTGTECLLLVNWSLADDFEGLWQPPLPEFDGSVLDFIDPLVKEVVTAHGCEITDVQFVLKARWDLAGRLFHISNSQANPVTFGSLQSDAFEAIKAAFEAAGTNPWEGFTCTQICIHLIDSAVDSRGWGTFHLGCCPLSGETARDLMLALMCKLWKKDEYLQYKKGEDEGLLSM